MVKYIAGFGGSEDRKGLASEIHVRPLREQLDALHDELPHGGLHDSASVQRVSKNNVSKQIA